MACISHVHIYFLFSFSFFFFHILLLILSVIHIPISFLVMVKLKLYFIPSIPMLILEKISKLETFSSGWLNVQNMWENPECDSCLNTMQAWVKKKKDEVLQFLMFTFLALLDFVSRATVMAQASVRPSIC